MKTSWFEIRFAHRFFIFQFIQKPLSFRVNVFISNRREALNRKETSSYFTLLWSSDDNISLLYYRFTGVWVTGRCCFEKYKYVFFSYHMNRPQLITEVIMKKVQIFIFKPIIPCLSSSSLLKSRLFIPYLRCSSFLINFISFIY